MLKGLVRRSLQRCRIPLRFRDVLCAEHVKSICISPEGRAHVTVREKLVFLAAPEPGDLHDICAVDAETTPDNFILQSPDSVEIGRRQAGPHSFVIGWQPRLPVTRFGVYEHEYSWVPAGSHLQPALFTEFQCHVRTGHVCCELLTPHAFEGAVVFERPRWRWLNTERQLVKQALTLLESGGQRATIHDNGQRIEWRLAEPKVGVRYLCVAFHQHGVAHCAEQVSKTSIGGQLRRLVGRFAPG